MNRLCVTRNEDVFYGVQTNLETIERLEDVMSDRLVWMVANDVEGNAIPMIVVCRMSRDGQMIWKLSEDDIRLAIG